MNPLLRTILLVFSAGICGLILAGGITYWVGASYKEFLTTTNMQQDSLESFINHKPFAVYLEILSIDPSNKTLVATVRSSALNEDVPTLIYYGSEGTTIERRDGRVEQGILVGTTATVTKAQLLDLKQGTRGYAGISILEDGKFFLRYLLIGDPLSRP